MDSVTPLIARARSAGLEVRVRGEALELRGPKSLGSLAREILARKADLLAEVDAERVRRQAEAPWAILPEGADPDHPPSGWIYVRAKGPLRGCWVGPDGELAGSTTNVPR